MRSYNLICLYLIIRELLTKKDPLDMESFTENTKLNTASENRFGNLISLKYIQLLSETINLH